MKDHLTRYPVYTLSPHQHIRLLLLLTYRLMNSAKAQVYVNNLQSQLTKMWSVMVAVVGVVVGVVVVVAELVGVVVLVERWGW